MAMLAERRTKRKWCLNPNGNNWSEDNNKFGQKMLEKMGWKKGCGLGINLQGQKEHVKVSVKNDSKGLGCGANYDLEWLNHQENYNTLLSELSSSVGDGILTVLESSSGKSLEDKSKMSRARVHYNKFVRGKDVSRYSGTDLMCILGKAEAVAQTRPIDKVKNEVPETNPKIKPKKKKRNKIDDRCNEEIEEYADDGNSSYSDMALMYVSGNTESVMEETRPAGDVENEVSETNGQASMKRKKKKKGSSNGRNEEIVRCSDLSKYPDTDPMYILEKTEAVTQKRPIDEVENEDPETNPKVNRKKKKKDKSKDSCVKQIIEEYYDSSKSRNEGNCYPATDLMVVVGKTESVMQERRPADDIGKCGSEGNGQSRKEQKKKKKKRNPEECEDGHNGGCVEESPENRKWKRKTSVETNEVLTRNTAVWQEELQCKSEEDEDSFSGSNLHVVKGYKYNCR